MNYSIAPISSAVDLHQPKYEPVVQSRSKSMLQQYSNESAAAKFLSQPNFANASSMKGTKFNLSLAQLSQQKQKSNLVLKASSNAKFKEALSNLKKNSH